jgi:hypothetical protein
VLRGNAQTNEQTPLFGGRVSVREGPSTNVEADGAYTLRGVAPGTQWVSVQAIGREPFGRAVDVRPGDTTWFDVALGPLAVTLKAVRVVAKLSRRFRSSRERRTRGTGYSRLRKSWRVPGRCAAHLVLPDVRFASGMRPRFVVMLPNPSVGGRGYYGHPFTSTGSFGLRSATRTTPPPIRWGRMYPRATSPLHSISVRVHRLRRPPDLDRT